MLLIHNYLINKDEILYIEKEGFKWLSIHFKSGKKLDIEYCNEDERNLEFDNIYLGERN